ncbi:MAG: OmpA family protein [Nitrospirae bacterium]|nr:OmpA family protein [Nitrospirota bacterium]
MKIRMTTLIVMGTILVTGCVTKGTHTQTLADLEEARKATAKTAADFESFKKQAATDTDSLKKQLEATQQELGSSKKALEDATTRIAALEKEKEQTTAALTESRDQARDLTTKLEAEKSQVASLQEDKQRLMSGTTTAQEEIARLQKRAGELETETARAKDLEKRLAERDQEIGKLRQASADRESLAAKVAALTGALQGQEERLKAEEAEKARLEQERAAKEAEIQRLTKTHEDLTKSLEAEIAKGDIKIKQVRDRLTINMVEKVLFDSGQAKVKPAGLTVLKQVSDILKNVTDKQIRIEGHTDNVPIGVKLKERFPTNWELSTARATSVVRYLIEEGGVNRANLSAVGYSDTRPVAGNDTEEGRTSNRRIEITLYPKDLSEIASQITKP